MKNENSGSKQDRGVHRFVFVQVQSLADLLCLMNSRECDGRLVFNLWGVSRLSSVAAVLAYYAIFTVTSAVLIWGGSRSNWAEVTSPGHFICVFLVPGDSVFFHVSVEHLHFIFWKGPVHGLSFSFNLYRILDYTVLSSLIQSNAFFVCWCFSWGVF